FSVVAETMSCQSAICKTLSAIWIHFYETGELTLDVTGVNTVIGEFESIQDALSWLDLKVISNTATVTIKLSSQGVYTNYDTIEVDHPNGNRIHIGGNGKTVTFSEGETGLQLKDGNRLGSIRNIVLDGNYLSAHWGVHLIRSSSIHIRENVEIRGFKYDGIYAANGSSVDCAPSLYVHHNGREGIQAVFGSYVYAGWNDGSNGSSVESSHNVGGGFVTHSSSGIFADRALAQNNGGDGFIAYGVSSIEANNTIRNGNGGYGYHAFDGGMIRGSGSSSSQANTDGFSRGDAATGGHFVD
ncbi:hypothetical protein MLD52_16590, partial [Puniceicoccaceae bacterium K14]|nr:hypothetical protein [Puniceicoccaceae bacterium K14]